MKKEVTILMGPSSGGKTFEARKRCHNAYSTVISVDDIKYELYGNEGSWYMNHGSFQELLRLFRKALFSQGGWSQLIYLDYPFLTRQSREQVYKEIKKSNVPCDVYIEVFAPPFEVCLERNKRRNIPLQAKTIARQFKKLSWPLTEIPQENVYVRCYDKSCYPDVFIPNWMHVHTIHDIQRVHREMKGGVKHAILPNRSVDTQPLLCCNMGKCSVDDPLRDDKLGTVEHPPELHEESVERMLRHRVSLFRRGHILSWFKG